MILVSSLISKQEVNGGKPLPKRTSVAKLVEI